MKEYQGKIMNMCMVGLFAVGFIFMYMDQRTIARENHDRLHKLIADHFHYQEVMDLEEKPLMWVNARAIIDGGQEAWNDRMERINRLTEHKLQEIMFASKIKENEKLEPAGKVILRPSTGGIDKYKIVDTDIKSSCPQCEDFFIELRELSEKLNRI